MNNYDVRSLTISGHVCEGEVSHVGVDVISMSRLSRVLNRSPRLFDRLCQREERADLSTALGVGLEWATLLWTSKEAAAKCLQTGFWRAGIDWPDLQILVFDQDILKVCPQVLSHISELARSQEGVEVRVRSHRAAAKLLGSDEVSGRFTIGGEVGVCVMHRVKVDVCDQAQGDV